MDLDHRKYQSGKKRGLILDDLELYQYWLEYQLKYEIQQVSLDEYRFYVGDRLYIKYINCSKVSEAFLKECLTSDITFILEDGYDETDDSFETIDAEELLDEWIKEGSWDWKKEVKERNSHGEISFDIEKIKKEVGQGLREFLFFHQEEFKN